MRFEPGAGGNYTQVRGFDAQPTWSAHDLADPRLRGRRRVAQSAGEVAETSVVPGGTLTAGPGGLAGLEDEATFDEHGIEVQR